MAAAQEPANIGGMRGAYFMGSGAPPRFFWGGGSAGGVRETRVVGGVPREFQSSRSIATFNFREAAADPVPRVLHNGPARRPRAPLEGWAGACLAVPRAGRRLSLSSTPFFRWQREAADDGLYDCMDAQSSKRVQFVTYSYMISSLKIW